MKLLRRFAAHLGTLGRFVLRATCPHPCRIVNSEAYREDMKGNIYPATCERCGHEKYVTGAMVQADMHKCVQKFDAQNAELRSSECSQAERR